MSIHSSAPGNNPVFVKHEIVINVNLIMYTFDCLRMYTFVNLPSSYAP
jgi:hypothetical protein